MASRDFDTDVLIVGAGPAGLVLACDLARRGVAFRLIDRRAGPMIASRGKGLQPRTLEVFEDLGVLPQILRLSGPYPLMRFFKGDTVLVERRLNEVVEPTPDVPYPNMLMAGQWNTEEALRSRLAVLGGHVDQNQVLMAITQDDDGISAMLAGRDGAQTVRARYLVGADGGRSSVREALDVAFPGETTPGPRYLFGDVTLEGVDRDVWSLWPGEAGVTGLCPLPHTDKFQLMVALGPNEEPDLDIPTVQRLVQSRSGRDDIVIKTAPWLSLFKPSLRLAERYRVGRAFLVGDAAHVHPPTGAQGLNTSVQDAYNLGWKLALTLKGASKHLLDTYQEERRPIADGVLWLSGNLARMSADGQTRGRETQQLDISYRGGSLAPGPADDASPVAAGDRAPDAPFDTLGGGSRLFEAFMGPRFTLLLFGEAPKPVGLEGLPVRTLRLPSDAALAAATYGISGDGAVLVRPDGYIALIDRAPTTTVAADWLAEHVGLRAAA